VGVPRASQGRINTYPLGLGALLLVHSGWCPAFAVPGRKRGVAVVLFSHETATRFLDDHVWLPTVEPSW
jgi:hypothetical protein